MRLWAACTLCRTNGRLAPLPARCQRSANWGRPPHGSSGCRDVEEHLQCEYGGRRACHTNKLQCCCPNSMLFSVSCHSALTVVLMVWRWSKYWTVKSCFERLRHTHPVIDRSTSHRVGVVESQRKTSLSADMVDMCVSCDAAHRLHVQPAISPAL